MGRMGSGNSISAKRMIKNILRCEVTERAIDIADIIYGTKPVSALIGESKKRKSPAASILIRPRSVQEMQHVFLDLMFIAPLAFLVVISKPLDMTFCQILDSDSSGEATVATRRNIAKLEKAINNIISSI